MHSRLIIGAAVLVGVGGCLEFVGERGGAKDAAAAAAHFPPPTRRVPKMDRGKGE